MLVINYLEQDTQKSPVTFISSQAEIFTAPSPMSVYLKY